MFIFALIFLGQIVDADPIKPGQGLTWDPYCYCYEDGSEMNLDRFTVTLLNSDRVILDVFNLDSTADKFDFGDETLSSKEIWEDTTYLQLRAIDEHGEVSNGNAELGPIQFQEEAGGGGQVDTTPPDPVTSVSVNSP